ncbi:hypothetical protein ACFRAE_03615 [Sphingobacterium sp. HJSM2_6]|uniref:hypothetical protein n=1 Tax=Sphingobacterium sp. HJSM2_6 TaxID=3366264 RepID=UPI003BE08190
MKQLASIIIPFLLLSACQSANKPNDSADSTTIQLTEKSELKSVANEELTAFLTTLPEIALPFTDSTNFENFNKNEGHVNLEVLKLLKFKPEYPNPEQIRFRYQVKFDQGLTGLVLTFPNSESDLKTVLLTLDENNQRLDVIEIAYDEVIESAFKLISVLDKNKISSEHWNYFFEKPTVDKKIFILDNNLRFVQQ